MLEYEITKYVVQHGDILRKLFNSLSKYAEENPILKSHFEEAKMEEVRQYFANEMNKNYEEVAIIIDQEFMNKWLKS